MGNGTKEKPLTREDVLRLIEENGGKTVGLDLSGKEFESGIDLSKLNLSGIILEGASLTDAHFEGSALLGAHPEGADLSFAHFEGAELFFTYLEGAFLWSTHFSLNTRLEGVRWGNYTVDLEMNKENIETGKQLVEILWEIVHDPRIRQGLPPKMEE